MLSDSDFSCAKKINIHAVLAFVAVMQSGSLLGASIVLDTSPSNVSILLKKFCSFYSTKLFERDGRTLQPTQYAFELHEVMENLCKDLIGVIKIDSE
jgi:DNA-binding transcriptional LysR family regulator